MPDDRFDHPTPVTDIRAFDVVALSSDTAAPWARLENNGLSIVVGQAVSSSTAVPEAFMTLWGDPRNGYLSLEAWLGKPNALASGDGLCRLPPGERLSWTVTMTVEDDGQPSPQTPNKSAP